MIPSPSQHAGAWWRCTPQWLALLALLLVATSCLPKQWSPELWAKVDVDENGEPERVRLSEAARRVGQTLGEGALDGLTEAERQQVLQGRVQELVDAMLVQATTNLDEDIGPELRDELTLAIQAALAELTGPDARRDVNGLGSALAKGVGDTFTTTVERDLGPALGDVVERELMPALAAGFREELRPELNATVRELSVSAMDGVAESLEGPMGEALAHQRALLIADLKVVLDESEDTFNALSVTLIVLGSVLFLGVLVLTYLFRKAQSKAKAIDQALHLVASRFKDSQDLPGVWELIQAISNNEEDDEGAGYFARVLEEEWPEVKSKKTPAAPRGGGSEGVGGE